MSKKHSTRQTLEIHSEIKIKIIKHYYEIFLNITYKWFPKINFYDLMCGEGVYKNKKHGSPLIIAKKSFDFVERNQDELRKRNVKLNLFFNDNGKSDIEKGKFKVDRVEEQILSSDYDNEIISVNYDKKDVNLIIENIISNSSKNNDGISIIFIDPWGYSDIDYKLLKELKKTKLKFELIIFIPISFISRFLENSLIENEKKESGDSIKKLVELLKLESEKFKDNQLEIVTHFEQKLKEYIGFNYANSFLLKNISSYYSLFAFTDNKTGYRKFLESQWKIDQNNGNNYDHRTHDICNMYVSIHESDLNTKIYNLIKQKPGISNLELQEFIYSNKYLPAHLKDYLDNLVKINILKVISSSSNTIIHSKKSMITSQKEYLYRIIEDDLSEQIELFLK